MLALGQGVIALTLGGMVFFAAFVAPTVFQALPADAAGGFLRKLFPRYYLFLIIGSGLAALLLLQTSLLVALICLVITVSTVWVRQVMVPEINRLRDQQLSGDEAAGIAFDRRHRFSVVINMLQLLLLLGVWFVLIP